MTPSVPHARARVPSSVVRCEGRQGCAGRGRGTHTRRGQRADTSSGVRGRVYAGCVLRNVDRAACGVEPQGSVAAGQKEVGLGYAKRGMQRCSGACHSSPPCSRRHAGMKSQHWFDVVVAFTEEMKTAGALWHEVQGRRPRRVSCREARAVAILRAQSSSPKSYYSGMFSSRSPGHVVPSGPSRQLVWRRPLFMRTCSMHQARVVAA